MVLFPMILSAFERSFHQPECPQSNYLRKSCMCCPLHHLKWYVTIWVKILLSCSTGSTVQGYLWSCTITVYTQLIWKWHKIET